MSERPKPQSTESKKNSRAEQARQAAQALSSTIEPCEDPSYGSGYRLVRGTTPESGATHLELYPGRALRYVDEAANLNIVLTDIAPVKSRNQRVRIESKDETTQAVLLLSANGSLILTLPARPGTEHAPTPAPEQQPRGERITITGRVGSDPHLSTTPRTGRPILRLPLATHDGKSTTTWFRVILFDDLARRAAETLTKGTECQIVGYPHEVETTDKEGNKIKRQEIYGVAIKTP